MYILTGPKDTLKDRLDCAYVLYENNKSNKIIVSGGYNPKVDRVEKDIMKDYLIKKGVAPEDIITDDSGFNTYASMKRCKEFAGNKSVIVCTQKMHVERSIYLGQNLGLNCFGFYSDKKDFSLIREFCARVKAFVNINICVPKKVSSISEVPFE